MPTQDHSIVAALRALIPTSRRPGRAANRIAPQVLVLETRLPLSTYTWTAGGDGMTWNDPNNWRHFEPRPECPGGRHADGVFRRRLSYAVDLAQGILEDHRLRLQLSVHAARFAQRSTTHTRSRARRSRSSTRYRSIIRSRRHLSGATTSVLLSGMKLDPGATVYTQTGSTAPARHADLADRVSCSQSAGL